MENLGLELKLPENPGPTHFPRDRTKQETVIDLVFVNSTRSIDLTCHRHLIDRGAPDHLPITIEIPIDPSDLQILRNTIKKGSESETSFLMEVT